MFKKFEYCLKKNYLIYKNPQFGSAWDIYQKIKDDTSTASVAFNMKNSLIAALQDKSQTIVNKLLTGKINFVRDTMILDTTYQELAHAFSTH